MDDTLNCIQKICITQNRKDFIKNILYKMLDYSKKHDKNNNTYPLKFLLSGSEGIGKTFTLIYLAHLLKEYNQYSNNIKLIYLSHCIYLNRMRLDYLKQEFEFSFRGDEENINNINFLNELMYNFRESINKYRINGYMTILIVDQLNSLNNSSIFLFEELVALNWNFIVCSQSSTNIIKPELKQFFKDCDKMNYDDFFNENDIKKIVLKNDINLSESDFKNIYAIVYNNPRETFKILNLEGGNLQEKIEVYKDIRGLEIKKQHGDFRNENPSFREELAKSIYYMDTKLELKLIEGPFINNQFMKIKLNMRHYRIDSVFPFAGEVLKSMYNQVKKSDDFYSKRIEELSAHMQAAKQSPSTIGIYYEKLIHTYFENLFYRKCTDKLFLIDSNIVNKEKNLSEVQFF